MDMTPSAPEPMEEWEYCMLIQTIDGKIMWFGSSIVSPVEPLEKILRRLGEDGWEMVRNARPANSGDLVYTFKRRRRNGESPCPSS
jgi:hypothetical protein